MLQSQTRPRFRTATLPVFAFLLACLAFLYLQLFLLPRTPLALPGDGTIFVNNALRMLDGEVIYRDFFQITTPGTELVYFICFRFFDASVTVYNVIVMLTGLALAALNVVIARRVISGWMSLMPALLLLTFQFRFERTGSHHWFSMLIVMAALAVVIERRTARRLIAAGALCGLATCFTQHRGVMALAGLAAFVVWEERRMKSGWRALLRAEALLISAFGIVAMTMPAYFISQAGLMRFIECTVIFPAKYYSGTYWMNNPGVYLSDLPTLAQGSLFVGAVRAFTYALVPLVYVAFWFHYRHRRGVQPDEQWDRLMLLNLAGIFLFLGVASAPGWYRLTHVSQPGLILLCRMLSQPGWWRRRVSLLLALTASLILVRALFVQQRQARRELMMPAGRVSFQSDESFRRYEWVARQTRPGEYFFSPSTDFYFLGRLRNPAAVQFLLPSAYTRPEHVRSVIDGLERHQVRFVHWLKMLERPPAAPLRSEDNLEPLREYLYRHYHLVESFTDADYILERNR
ncbi:MAG TPA: hypothetical protein VNQ79_25950 [Blastocatellia bacterium]|nr:hypothetical protein [Blastocatellia bacterium]